MFTFTPASLTFLPPGILSHVYLGIQPSVKTGIQDFFSGPESLLQVNCLSRAGQVHIQRSLPATTTLWFPGYEPRTVGDRGQQTRTNAFYPHWQFFTLSCPHLPLHNPAPLFPSVSCCDVQPHHSLPPLQCLPCRWSLNFEQFTRSFHSDMESKEKSVEVLSVMIFWRYPWQDCQEGNAEKLAIDMLLKIHVPLQTWTCFPRRHPILIF